MLARDVAPALRRVRSGTADPSRWDRVGVARVMSEMAPGAVVLPLVVIDKVRVFPVILLNREEIARRSSSGVGAILDREAILSEVEELDGPVAWSSPLRMSAFVTCESPKKALQDLPKLWAYARCLVLVESAADLAPSEAFECDAEGIAVARVDGSDPAVLVSGNPGPRPGTSMPEFWVRLREEQLFHLALASSYRDEDICMTAEYQAPR